jgi:predicted AAA+ superfamily ATPase
VSQPSTVAAIVRRTRDDPDDPDSPERGTAQAYLAALRRMMIVDEVPAWDPAVRSSKRLVSTPKRHLADPSLAASLLHMSPARMLADLETAGFLFESLAAHDLRIYGQANDATCYHYREAEGRLEVDYILENRDGDWAGFEVKLGAKEIDKAAGSLLRLSRRVRRAPKALVVLTGTSLTYTRDDGVHVVPLGSLGS